MASLPTAEWHATLDQMDAALAETLAALDRYQERWDSVLKESAPPETGAVNPEALDRIEGRLRDWDARLHAAEELAASVGRELNDRETVVGRWQQTFTGWRDGIERMQSQD
jgi:hypothetical protein